MSALDDLLVDLEAEYEDARGLVDALPDDASEWDLPTPAEGWAVRDQVSHLAFFDDLGRMAMVEPEVFAVKAEGIIESGRDPMQEHLVAGRSMRGDALLEWWGGAHRAMAEAFAGADPSARVPWFGPPMGAMSFVSARLMETWAHGQDLADAFGRVRVASDRLRHVAHLGVRARPFSYAVRGLAVPDGRIDVTLTAPSGAEWTWEAGDGGGHGGADAGGSVSGPALDFCLVVTQRRNLADTDLVIRGTGATEWMEIAQAFAGPPGSGRAPLALG
ncbi:MAG: TIGR03084 family metal-binding protein [Acidimicrobiales bacterium]